MQLTDHADQQHSERGKDNGRESRFFDDPREVRPMALLERYEEQRVRRFRFDLADESIRRIAIGKRVPFDGDSQTQPALQVLEFGHVL